MTQVIIENLDPFVVKKLSEQASLRGRSLQSEIKYILETVVSSNLQLADSLPLMPLEDLRRNGQEAARKSGYDSREKIIQLVQEVKLEIANERRFSKLQ